MKKLIGLLVVICATGACTTPEEDAQIRLFWMEQMAQLALERTLPNVPPPSQSFSDEKSSQEAPEDLAQKAEPPLDVPSVAQTPLLPSSKSAAQPQAPAPVPSTVEAMLFVSPTCPRCQRLRREGWVSKFKNKYAGKVQLTEYDLSLPQNEKLLLSMMRKHHLTRVGYPTLFIDGQVVQGYPLNADPVVAKVLAKHGWTADASSQKPILEITLEDSHVNKLKSNAPLKDRQAMQRSIERIKQSNQQALQDIGSIFGADTQAQALSIVAKSEKILFRTANVCTDYQSYLSAQQKVLQEQEAQLNQLMRANAYKMRRIRG